MRCLKNQNLGSMRPVFLDLSEDGKCEIFDQWDCFKAPENCGTVPYKVPYFGAIFLPYCAITVALKGDIFWANPLT